MSASSGNRRNLLNLSASLTINGYTFSFVGDYFGEVYGCNSCSGSFSEVYAGAATSNWSTDLTTYAYNYSGNYPASLTDPISIALGGYVQVGSFNSGNDSLGLSPTHLTIGSPVPEPETYALLLAGLGLLGYAARRRKLKEAAAA